MAADAYRCVALFITLLSLATNSPSDTGYAPSVVMVGLMLCCDPALSGLHGNCNMVVLDLLTLLPYRSLLRCAALAHLLSAAALLALSDQARAQTSHWLLLQQLYMFGGLLSLFAVINSMPLASVGKIAYVGAIWHVLGELPFTPPTNTHLHMLLELSASN